MEEEIRSKDCCRILKSLDRIRASIRKNEYIPELLVKYGLIESCCSFLKDVESKDWERKELAICMENVSWITTNLSAMPGNQTSILTRNGTISSYLRILLDDSAIITKETLENVFDSFF